MHRRPNFGVSPHNPIRVLLWIGRRSRILQECLWAGERHGIVIDLFVRYQTFASIWGFPVVPPESGAGGSANPSVIIPVLIIEVVFIIVWGIGRLQVIVSMV